MNQNDGFLAEKLKVQSNWHGIHTFRNCQLKIRFDLVLSDQYCDSECALNWYPSTGTGLLLLALSTFGKVNVLLFNGCRKFCVNSFKVHTNLKFLEMATIVFSRGMFDIYLFLGVTQFVVFAEQCLSVRIWEPDSDLSLSHTHGNNIQLDIRDRLYYIYVCTTSFLYSRHQPAAWVQDQAIINCNCRKRQLLQKLFNITKSLLKMAAAVDRLGGYG